MGGFPSNLIIAPVAGALKLNRTTRLMDAGVPTWVELKINPFTTFLRKSISKIYI